MGKGLIISNVFVGMKETGTVQFPIITSIFLIAVGVHPPPPPPDVDYQDTQRHRWVNKIGTCSFDLCILYLVHS
jgi:hypothetical protein